MIGAKMVARWCSRLIFSRSPDPFRVAVYVLYSGSMVWRRVASTAACMYTCTYAPASEHTGAQCAHGTPDKARMNYPNTCMGVVDQRTAGRCNDPLVYGKHYGDTYGADRLSISDTDPGVLPISTCR